MVEKFRVRRIAIIQVVASPDEETASAMDKISETDEDLQKEKPETSEN